MFFLKRFLHLEVLFAALTFTLAAQINPGISEMTVEQSYLQESVELIIIREHSRTDSRESKLAALEYINAAINRGNKSGEIHSSLEYLALEGVLHVTRENGRIVNNFPDVRRQAATTLGLMGTPEAKTTLVRMVSSDYEPLVITEAIISLGKIGNNDNGEVVAVIARTINRFHTLAPDTWMALSALDAFEKIAAVNNGLTDRYVIETIMRISESHFYATPVRNRAKLLLDDLKRYRLGL